MRVRQALPKRNSANCVEAVCVDKHYELRVHVKPSYHTKDFMNTYTFGPFALIPDRFVLTCNGASQQLTPRLLTVLEYLIRNRNRVVTKDELITEVWNGSFIDEGIVARTVSTLRAMLADVAEKPKYIQTVSRVGYRFIHSVSIQHHDSFLLPGRNGTETTSGDPCFAGRRQELAVLKDRLMQCESGVGSIVCVSGRTGIGKTALAEKLLGAAQGRAVSARSRCAPVVSLAEPYAPFIDLFTDLLNASFDADLRQRLNGTGSGMVLASRDNSRATDRIGHRRPGSNELGRAPIRCSRCRDFAQTTRRALYRRFSFGRCSQCRFDWIPVTAAAQLVYSCSSLPDLQNWFGLGIRSHAWFMSWK